MWGLLALAGCSRLPGVETRMASAATLAASGGLAPFAAGTATLPLRGFARLGCDGEPLHVYIEGDGLAWLSISMPSPDPTPVNPVALQLAARDPGCNVLYLGRPGQYAGGGVDARYWLGGRFAPEVVAAYEAVVRQVAAGRHASALRLTGYSGGGAVAALLAARLHAAGLPVELVTVAGNLDTDTWTRRRKLSPLRDSLNPATEAPVLASVPQLHLTGRDDSQVPGWVLDAYLARLPDRGCVRVVEVAAGHAGPWPDAWAAAVAQPPACTATRQSLR
ncbi:MAG TPA: hypothetical protein VFV15_03625 [Moraxellaceae bacterium]|nr:hypothetical protein [Moraxellaceae bacterium]